MCTFAWTYWEEKELETEYRDEDEDSSSGLEGNLDRRTAWLVRVSLQFGPKDHDDLTQEEDVDSDDNNHGDSEEDDGGPDKVI